MAFIINKKNQYKIIHQLTSFKSFLHMGFREQSDFTIVFAKHKDKILQKLMVFKLHLKYFLLLLFPIYVKAEHKKNCSIVLLVWLVEDGLHKDAKKIIYKKPLYQYSLALKML